MTDFESLLRSVRSKTHAQLVTLTEPDMLKTSSAGTPNPVHGRIRKRTRLTAYLGANYAEEVNAQRRREGKPADFVPKKRPWGTRIGDSPLIEHKGQLYLEYQPDQVDDVAYELDGSAVPEVELEPWLRPKAKSSLQGVDDEVVVRLVKLSNLVSVSLN